MTTAYKIPRSVLVVIHTPDLQVLMMQRAGWPDFWQSVTGSLAHESEPLRDLQEAPQPLRAGGHPQPRARVQPSGARAASRGARPRGAPDLQVAAASRGRRAHDLLDQPRRDPRPASKASRQRPVRPQGL